QRPPPNGHFGAPGSPSDRAGAPSRPNGVPRSPFGRGTARASSLGDCGAPGSGPSPPPRGGRKVPAQSSIGTTRAKQRPNGQRESRHAGRGGRPYGRGHGIRGASSGRPDDRERTR